MSYQNLKEITRNYRFFVVGYGPAYDPNHVEIYVGTHHNSRVFQHEWIMGEINKLSETLRHHAFDTICINHYTQAIYGEESEEIVEKMQKICLDCGMSYVMRCTLWNASIFDATANDGFYTCYKSDYDKMLPALLAIHRLCKLFELNDTVTIRNIRKIIAAFYSKKEDQDMWFNRFRSKLLDTTETS